jgi:uncharacterized protein with PIN domain
MPMKSNNYEFVCDSMLGKLSRWLRVLGYDTIYSSNFSDEELISYVKKNRSRILLTRDKKLHDEFYKERFKVILIRDHKIANQLAYLNKLLNINLEVDPKCSRCSFCNNILVEIEFNDSIRGLVPPKIRLKNRLYWFCENCNKVFWKGKMWPNIKRVSKDAIELSMKI